jgi:hypothetical protein
MDRRKTVSLLAGITATALWMCDFSSAQGASDAANTQWVARILEEMDHIKPGMRRAELLKVFTTEGGLSTGLQRTYVSRHCPYFKVDVTFQAVGRPGSDGQGRVPLVEDARDRVVSISRPYLAFSVLD